MASRLRAFRADGPPIAADPKFYAQIPDDVLEDRWLCPRPGAPGVLGAILRLIRRSGSKDRTLVSTVAAVAREAGITARAASTHLAKLERDGLLIREPAKAAVGCTRQTLFRVVYNLRPTLALEADPPIVSRGSDDTSNRKKTSASNRKKTSGSSLLFEQRNTTEETTTSCDVEESSSFETSKGRPVTAPSACTPPPAQPLPQLGDLVAMVLAIWPALLNVEGELRPLIRLAGPDHVRLAIEYARLKAKSSPLGLIANTVKRRYYDGQSIEDAMADNLSVMPVARPRREPPARSSPRPDDVSPEEADRVRELVSDPDWYKRPLGAQKSRPGGLVAKLPPRAAGTLIARSQAGPDVDCSVNNNSRQGTPEMGDAGHVGHLVERDSNPSTRGD